MGVPGGQCAPSSRAGLFGTVRTEQVSASPQPAREVRHDTPHFIDDDHGQPVYSSPSSPPGGLGSVFGPRAQGSARSPPSCPRVSSSRLPEHILLPGRIRQPLRSYRLEPSVVLQLDGLLHAVLGLRIEKDMLSPSLVASHCEFFGRAAVESCSSVCALYWADAQFMPDAIMMAQEHLACGIFVVPVRPGAPPLLDVPSKTLARRRSLPWYDLLLSKSMLVFDLVPECFFPRPSWGMQAIFASFNYIGRIKRKRPESKFDVRPIKGLPSSRIGPVPFLLARQSPLANEATPRATDCLPATPYVGPVSSPAPSQGASNWDMALIRRIADGYPHPEIAELAVQAAGSGVDCFSGDLGKTLVPARSGAPDPDMASALRARFIEDVEVGRAWGPLPSPPFSSFRLCPTFTIPKDKHDPSSKRFRVGSNFSAGGRGSVNSLCFSPLPISAHFSAGALRDEIAAAGPGSSCYTADIPDCFRRNRILEKLLPLFVYKVESQEFGTEFFGELSTPFGWAPSEWGWQVILALVLWHFLKSGLPCMRAFVDNFFYVVPSGIEFAPQVARAEAVFAELGIALHEKGNPKLFKGLGWWWDLERMLMICPEDKFAAYTRLLTMWSSQTLLSLQALRTAVGVLSWVSAGFPIGKPHVAHLVHLRTKGEQIMSRTGSPPASVMVRVSEEAKFTLRFWKVNLSLWDRSCPITRRFGPVASAQAMGRADASTQFGCGGLYFDGRVCLLFVHEWSREELDLAFATERLSTGILEMLGARWWAKAFFGRCAGLRVSLELDSASAVTGLLAGYSPNVPTMALIEPFLSECVRSHVQLKPSHVVGSIFNKVADLLSHNRVQEALCQAAEEFGVVPSLVALGPTL